MAERRMFAKTIIDSDAFLDMPASAQSLYFHLCMRADDDGFINNPKRIQRMVNCSDDDLKLLLAKRFILAFESGVIVVKHWKIHNYIRKDRYIPTLYQSELASLSESKNGSYTERLSLGQPNDNQRLTQVRLGKDSIGKVSIDTIGGEQSPLPVDVDTKETPFDMFWEEYPKKVGKEAARKAFIKAKSKVDLNTILQAIKTQKTSEQWQRDNGQYIPNPATWLNQGRWQDELTICKENKPNTSPPKKQVKYRQVERNGEIVLEVIPEDE
jgi:hypothetical protein